MALWAPTDPWLASGRLKIAFSQYKKGTQFSFNKPGVRLVPQFVTPTLVVTGFTQQYLFDYNNANKYILCLHKTYIHS